MSTPRPRQVLDTSEERQRRLAPVLAAFRRAIGGSEVAWIEASGALEVLLIEAQCEAGLRAQAKEHDWFQRMLKEEQSK